MNTQSVQVSAKDYLYWESMLDLWELDQVSEFFEDEVTGQIGALCCGHDSGSVTYFRAL